MPFAFPEAVPYSAPALPVPAPTSPSQRGDVGRATAGTVPDTAGLPENLNITQYLGLTPTNQLATQFGGNVMQTRGFDTPAFSYTPQNVLVGDGYVGNAGLIQNALNYGSSMGQGTMDAILRGLQLSAEQERAGAAATRGNEDSVFNIGGPNSIVQAVGGGAQTNRPVNFLASMIPGGSPAAGATTPATPASSAPGSALPAQAPAIPAIPSVISPTGGRPAGAATGTGGSVNLSTGLPAPSQFVSPFAASAGQSQSSYQPGSLPANPISTEQVPAPAFGGPVQSLETPNQSGNSPDNFLADLTNDTGWLRSMAESGMPIDQMPAWESMMAARQRNKDRNAAQLKEQVAAGGNAFSSVMSDALGEFYNQAALDENAQLSAMQAQAMEAARGRQFGAGQTLAGLAANAGSQLSSQNFQALTAEQQQALQAALAMAGGADQAAGMLAGFGNQAGQQLLQNSMGAASNLFNAENMANMQLNQNQLAALMQMIGYDTQSRGLDASIAQMLGNGEINWAQLGSQLGQQEFGIEGMNFDRTFQEWLRTRPENSPLLSLFTSLATNQPQQYFPQFQPSAFSQILGPVSGIAQAAIQAGV